MDSMLSSTLASAPSEKTTQSEIRSSGMAYHPLPSLNLAVSTKDNDGMASTLTSSPKSTGAQKVNISNLISPPEFVFDSFSSAAVPRQLVQSSQPVHMERKHLESGSRPSAPMSPPISPEQKDQASPALAASIPVKDPILYPPTESSPSPSRPVPLFASNDERPVFRVTHAIPKDNLDSIIDGHILATGQSKGSERPAREDYKLALYFRADVWRRFQANPSRWLRQEKALLAADRASHSAAFTPLAKSQPKPIRSSNVHRVQKPAKTKEPRVAKPQPRPIRTNVGPVRSTIRVSSTPEPRVRTVAASREDKDFNSLPDLCPPLNSLPAKPDFHVEWKAQPLDLSNDPHAHLLHPEEVRLAAALRLDCATYLTSKRRIFENRLYCARIGKEFRKTDAQKACKIDVNKASKLWSAYDSVHWLDLHWMAPYLK